MTFNIPPKPLDLKETVAAFEKATEKLPLDGNFTREDVVKSFAHEVGDRTFMHRSNPATKLDEEGIVPMVKAAVSEKNPETRARQITNIVDHIAEDVYQAQGASHVPSGRGV